nr:uncharacterized mitochondrial protein AtMg00810-like [Tanacetum cinerariifolium]
MGYDDYQIGNVTISKVYFVKGLGHNLFSVRQFCDSDLEVAFRQHTCFIRNLEARQGLVRGLPKLKFEKDHLCSACEMGKSKKKSHKPKSEDTNQEKLYLLHMDLYGPMRVKSVNGKNDVHPAPKVIAPIAEVVAPEHARSTGLPSSTTVDQDAPSSSKSQSTPKTQPPVITNNVEEDNHDIKVAHIDALTQSYWIKEMQEEINKFERLEVWELVPRPDTVMVITLKWIYKVKLDDLGDSKFLKVPEASLLNQSKYALESLKKYSFESCDPVDTPMVEKSKLDEDKEGKAVDPSYYRGMIGTLLYLTVNRLDLQFTICMCAWYQARPTEKHLHAVKRIFRYLRGTVNRGLWYPKDYSIALTAFADADHAADVPKIYMQEFWATATVHHHSIRFKMNNKKCIVNLEYFREMLQISPRIPNQQFDELPFKEEILAFLRDLGHSGEITMITDVEHKDAKKSNEMYYPRFTKYSVILPVELTNEAIRNSESYKEYYAIASGAEPPKTKASVRKKQSSSDTTVPLPTKGKM